MNDDLRPAPIVERMDPPISRVLWSPDFVSHALEVLSVAPDGPGLVWLKPLHAQALRIGLSRSGGIVVPVEVIHRLGAGNRPPVLVDLNGYQYRNTVGVMGTKHNDQRERGSQGAARFLAILRSGGWTGSAVGGPSSVNPARA